MCKDGNHEMRDPSYLGFIGEADDETGDGEGRLVDERVINALVTQVTAEHPSVGGETSDGNADVIVDFEDLALVRRQLRRRLVHGGQHDVAFRPETHGRRSLLHGLHCVLHLEQTPRRAPCRHVRVVLVSEHPFRSLGSLLAASNPPCAVLLVLQANNEDRSAQTRGVRLLT